MYKIRQKSTGLFSTGGSVPRFTKKGKIWRRKGDLSSHLNLVSGRKCVYDDCEVIVLETIEVEIQDMSALLDETAERIEARKKEHDRNIALWRLKRAEKELQEAKRAALSIGQKLP